MGSLKASELRIGNWVIYKGSRTEECPVDAHDLLGLMQCEKADEESFLNPIPITEEWLLRFGFIHYEDQEIWNHENICISYNSEMPDRGFKLYANHEYEIGAAFKSVHQLQNLFFCLYNKELTISNG